MQRADHGKPVIVSELIYQLQNLLLMPQVESGGGFVKQQHRGVLA